MPLMWKHACVFKERQGKQSGWSREKEAITNSIEAQRCHREANSVGIHPFGSEGRAIGSF